MSYLVKLRWENMNKTGTIQALKAGYSILGRIIKSPFNEVWAVFVQDEDIKERYVTCNNEDEAKEKLIELLGLEIVS